MGWKSVFIAIAEVLLRERPGTGHGVCRCANVRSRLALISRKRASTLKKYSECALESHARIADMARIGVPIALPLYNCRIVSFNRNPFAI
jgi:hypothetical protein